MTVVTMEKYIDAHSFRPMYRIQLVVPLEHLIETQQSHKNLAEVIGQEFLDACEQYRSGL